MLPVTGTITQDGQLALAVLAPPGHPDIPVVAALVAEFTPKITAYPQELHCALSWAVVVQCAFTFGAAWTPSPELSAWIDAEAAKRMVPQPLEYPMPREDLKPYAHQLTGAAMIKSGLPQLFTDEPGTGKTITAILGLSELLVSSILRSTPTPEPILVIAPASVVDPWVQAIRLWAPHWRVAAYRGPRRGNLLGGFDVYVCSYDVARIDAPTGRRGPLNRLAPQSVVIDECHMIKDPGTKRSQAVVRIARDAPFVIGMSGTPITHHTGNLTPMLEAMDHWAWPSGDRFRERYLLTEKEDYGVKVIGLAPHTEPEFRATLEGQMRRVAKEDVLDLPPKIYSVRTVDLPAAYRKAYDEFEQDMITQLPDGDELQVMHTFTVMTHLKSLACAPADVRYEVKEVEDTDEFSPTFGQMIEKKSVHLDLKAPSWKVAVMLEILEERPDQPVLVFAPSKQLIMLAGEAAAKAGRRVGYIVGGQSAKQRTAVVDGFQSGVYDVVCVTTQAGGVGITLTAAKTLVFLQRPVSSVDATQAEDRAHRIGQVNEHVEIIDIIATDTIDTRIREILKNNAGQLSELVKDPRIRAQLLGGLRADGRAA